MKILYISQYFYPEVGATTNRGLANVRYLADKGHQVTVLTEMPNHPKGIIFDGYKSKIFVTEKMENFSIKRLWVFVSNKKRFYTRILFYLSFAVFGSLYVVLNARKYDRIYLTSPPLFVGIIGFMAKLFYPKKKIVFEVRDLWPDCAIQMGELNNKTFIKLSCVLESLIYKKSDKIIAVTKYIKDMIVEKGHSEDKVVVVYNGIEADVQYLEVEKRIDEIESKRNEGYFIAIYAGVLGLAQNLSTIIKAAPILKKERICFFFVGAGPKEKELKQLAKELDNVYFCGEVSRKDVHNYLLSADCGIIPLAALPIFRGHIPSKLFEYMAFGLPVLLGVEGESAQILETAKAGLTFQPDNEQDLANKLRQLKTDPKQLKQYGLNGKEYVLQHFDRSKQAKIIEEILLHL